MFTCLQKGQEKVQRIHVLKGQLAFQKRVLKDEELKLKGEEMAYEMFYQNVEDLRKRVDNLKLGKIEPVAGKRGSMATEAILFADRKKSNSSI